MLHFASFFHAGSYCEWFKFLRTVALLPRPSFRSCLVFASLIDATQRFLWRSLVLLTIQRSIKKKKTIWISRELCVYGVQSQTSSFRQSFSELLFFSFPQTRASGLDFERNYPSKLPLRFHKVHAVERRASAATQSHYLLTYSQSAAMTSWIIENLHGIIQPSV